jgi:hypothetical protein
MPTLSGPGIHGKIIKVRPYDDEGNDTLLPLTERMRGLLLAMTEYLDWKNRWESLPSPLDNDDTRDSYVSELKNRLMIVINICEKMIECITTDEDTINAFATFMLNQINNNVDIRNALQQVIQQRIGEERPISVANDNLIYGKDGCSFDNLYGAMRFLVRWMNQNNIDFLEQMNAGITPEALNANVSKLFPGFQGNGLIDATLPQITSLLTGAILENYDAYYTQEYEDELICAFFCLAQSDCAISFNSMYFYFVSRLGFGPTAAESFGNAISFAVTGALTLSGYTDFMFYIQLGAFKFLGGFGEYTTYSPMETALNEGWDDASDDWTNCDDCGFWAQDFSDVDGWGDWVIDPDSFANPMGEFVTGGINGLSGVIGSNAAHGIQVRNPTPLSMVFSVKVFYSYTHGDGSYGQNVYTSVGFDGFDTIIEGTDVENTKANLAPSAAGIGIQFLTQFGGTVTGDVFITKIRVYSPFGSNPY